MATKREFRSELEEVFPKLRALAIGLCGNTNLADDLVQDAVLKGWQNRHRFRVNTNLSAWLYTILRNQYFDLLRKRKREVEDIDGQYAATLRAPDSAEACVRLQRLISNMAKLPPDQREALTLVGAAGMTYDEAAIVMQCAPGTVKSRVSRARTRLESYYLEDVPEKVASVG